ncbi:MAG: hypothetical protein CVV22_06585 [Ignavibacteriae bacterium HGW-Ignavibacteriae-1]|nr:MAG: hypothetical protein CVV22_06585 [Ignavibacteriae bacterium HGW-Ignavibacteriae-1]
MIHRFLYGAFATFLALSVIAIGGCECVPDITTPKEITPENSSFVRIINALPDHPEIELESNDIKISTIAYYSGSDSSLYQKFHAGNSFIRIKSINRNQVIANQAYLLTKDKHYSLISYGRGSLALTALIEDELETLQTGSSGVRLMNFTDGMSELTFSLIGLNNHEQSIAYSSYSEFIKIQSGDYLVKIRDGAGNEIATENIKIAPGINYDLISKGYLTDALNNIFLQLISINKSD